MADHSLRQLGAEAQHRLDLVGEHLADRDAGPAGDHLGDGLRIHRNLHQRRFALSGAEIVYLDLEIGLHGA